jgi:hypothetical protein
LPCHCLEQKESKNSRLTCFLVFDNVLDRDGATLDPTEWTQPFHKAAVQHRRRLRNTYKGIGTISAAHAAVPTSAARANENPARTGEGRGLGSPAGELEVGHEGSD